MRKSPILPENAKLVFKGRNYETWHWEQKMYDGSVKIFEVVKKCNEVTILAVINGKIMMQKQEQPHREPFLSLPGGRCEIGETPEETAHREFLEETGYITKNMELRRIVPSAYSSVLREAYYFIAKDCHKTTGLNLDGGEKIINELIDFEDFLMLSENDKFRDTDLIPILLRLRLNNKEQEEFKKILLG